MIWSLSFWLLILGSLDLIYNYINLKDTVTNLLQKRARYLCDAN